MWSKFSLLPVTVSCIALAGCAGGGGVGDSNLLLDDPVDTASEANIPVTSAITP